MVIKRDIIFTPKNQTRKLHIYLPDNYYETDERYPVMYFFDGHNLFFNEDATYGKSWGLKEFLDSWEKPIIIVGIECSHEGTSRLVEYCPYHFTKGFLGEINGTGDETVRFMTEELKPMIDREFRTYSFREATAIGGSSMGGLMSLYAVVKYNKVFSKAACLSSSIHPCMEDFERDINGGEIDPDTRVYLSWGTEEAKGMKGPIQDEKDTTLWRNSHLAELIEKHGARTRIYAQPGGHHCEASWELQVPGFMNFLWLDR